MTRRKAKGSTEVLFDQNCESNSFLHPLSSPFIDLPFELRSKIYREVFANADFDLVMSTRDFHSLAIEDYRSPEDVSFFRVSSQIYKEALPELATTAQLWLYFNSADPEHECDVADIPTSNLMPMLLKRCIPLIRTVNCYQLDLDANLITGFANFLNLKALHLRAQCLLNHEIDLFISEADNKSSGYAAWEGKTMAKVQELLDQDPSPLSSVVREAAARLKVYEVIFLRVFEASDQEGTDQGPVPSPLYVPEVSIDVEVCSMAIVERGINILAKDRKTTGESDEHWSRFDIADALIKGIQALTLPSS